METPVSFFVLLRFRIYNHKTPWIHRNFNLGVVASLGPKFVGKTSENIFSKI